MSLPLPAPVAPVSPTENEKREKRPRGRAFGKLLTLKYPAICRECGAHLPAGSTARYYGPAAVYGRGCHPDLRGKPQAAPAQAPLPAPTPAPLPVPAAPIPAPVAPAPVSPSPAPHAPDWDALIESLYQGGN